MTAGAAGCHYSLALTSTGRVLAWGGNAHGELGDGKTVQTGLPVEAKLPVRLRATAITACCFQGLALTSTGQVLMA